MPFSLEFYNLILMRHFCGLSAIHPLRGLRMKLSWMIEIRNSSELTADESFIRNLKT